VLEWRPTWRGITVKKYANKTTAAYPEQNVRPTQPANRQIRGFARSNSINSWSVPFLHWYKAAERSGFVEGCVAARCVG
jgi:hypothetical protein